MERLFVGLEIPPLIREELMRLQQCAPSSSRLSTPDQWHLTLVFIGQAELYTARQALSSVNHFAPKITLTKPGYFGAGRRLSYWVGIEPTPELLSLHHTLRTALQNAGLQSDDRSFVPHITLARSRGSATTAERERFMHQRVRAERSFYPADFCLFSSETHSAGPIYRVEGRYQLD
ncbi:RNA 2',3'-cyclic phosphodiesterase [Marinimicrobium sp. ABcell2]|uniref:RNA 2',3'-cyclic phosphodiesterase n=1 Tax=Marinimicrobium sp. ABcell2 TaxID=3069751 RepID=UPI0027B21BF0|nr:RNA 2',3'-cyclic phosphodiesterase [Marinimicrobium sp. ABcell2]MDQ2075749.1 RNA 2',3'-cyclic phosphodiesterase [Marinimicrobium sp. ABcell2]